MEEEPITGTGGSLISIWSDEFKNVILPTMLLELLTKDPIIKMKRGIK